MMKTRCIIGITITLLWSLLIPDGLLAQKLEVQIEERPSIRFERLTLEDGLSQGHVHDIIQDRRGFMWFATESGLNRYDGHDFKVYEPKPFDSASLADGTINDIHEAKDGAIWVATQYGGLNRLDPLTDTVSRFQHQPDVSHSLPAGPVNAVHEDHQGVLWVGMDRGISRMTPEQPGHFTHFQHVPGEAWSLSNNEVRSIKGDANGNLWVATANGLNRMHLDAPGRFTRFLHTPTAASVEDPIPESSLHEQYASTDQPGVIWIGSDNGLIRFHVSDGTSRRFFSTRKRETRDNVVMAVSPDPIDDGALWVATVRQGLVRFDPDTESFTRYSSASDHRYGLLDLASTYVFTGRSGVVWVGTGGAGINVFYPSTMKVTHYGVSTLERSILRNPNVWGLGITENEVLWASTDESYLHRIHLKTGTTRVWQADASNPLDPTRPAGTAFDFAEDPDGTLWIGTGKSLDRYDPATERFRHYRHRPADAESISNHNINVLDYDRSGALWIGTADGLNRYDADSDAFVRYRHDLESDGRDWIGDVLEDRNGRFWVATDEGICRLDRSTGQFVSHYHHDPGDPAMLTKGRFGWIHERSREPGVLWVSSLDGGGLDRLDTQTGTVTHHTTDTADLPDDTIYAILEGDEGRLWLSTNHGLVRFNPDAIPPHRPVRRFGLDSGLQGLEFNQHAAVEHHGQLVFGGVDGLNVFRPAALEGNAIPPQVTLTNLRIWNEPVSVGASSPLQRPLAQTSMVHLAHDQNQVAIEFLALHFKNPDRNRYRYRLDGYDASWVDAETRREATYTNLPPGTYRFQVQASNADGVWNQTGASVQLKIAPPWWQTQLAYAICVLLIGGAIGGGVYMQRRRQRKLEDAVNMRTRQVRHQNLQLAEQAEALRELDAAKRRFFANISHEFRTPLTILLGPTRDALRAETPMSLDDVAMVHRNGSRLQTLIDQLLDLSALDSGSLKIEPEWHVLGSLVESTAAMFIPLAERKEIEIAVDIPSAPIYAHLDSSHLQTALQNLISNAVKFTPSGGSIEVELSWAAPQEAGQKTAEIRVSDTGPGIPEDNIHRVFDRFHRGDSVTARTTGGSGIGLSLARERVTLNDGVLRAQNRPGVGTSFTISLTAQMSMPGNTAAPSTPAPPSPAEESMSNFAHAVGPLPASEERRHKTTEPEETPHQDREVDERPVVLIVEDNPDVRRYIRSVLEREEGTMDDPAESGFTIMEAKNGREGLEAATEELPDCIVADVMMPEMDGFEMGRGLMDDPMTEGIPLLYLTARADAENEVDGLDLGADGYLVKPFDSQLLRARVRGLIQKRLRLRELFNDDRIPTALGGDGQDMEAAPPNPFVASVGQAIAENLSDPDFGVSELAEAVALSRSQLYRRLKKELDRTPSAVLRVERLEHARRLLQQQAGTVSEVAYAVGFNSLSYFSTAFREHYQESPSAVLVEHTS